MKNIKNKQCKYCKKNYKNIYTDSQGYTYTVETTFCSRSCASRYKFKNNPQNSIIKILPNKDIIEQEILDFISSQQTYCTTAEVLKGINRSSKSLTKLGISIVELNTKLGFFKIKSIFEKRISTILLKNYKIIEYQKTFKGLVGITGYPLKVDFYIPSLNLVVEADGDQHKNINHPWHNNNPNGSIAMYDDIKNNFMIENNINIIRIPYKKVITEEYVLSKINFM